MTLEEKLAICKAWLEGKSLEIACKNTNKWVNLTRIQSLYFNFILYDYRIKEEPKKSIALCYKASDSGYLAWFLKPLERTDTIWKRCPEFDFIPNNENINEI